MKSVLAIALASVAAAQFIPTSPSSTFPTCALGCATLIEAQTLCIPPTAPTVDVGCFCNSGYLTTLHSSPDGGPCDAYCTVESDRQLLMTWYNNFCSSGGASAVPGTTSAVVVQATTTVPGVIAPTTIVTSFSTVSAPPTSTSASSSSSSSSSSNDSWIESHWKWVLMLAILLIGLGGLAYLAVWLKRRHRRKVEEKRATKSGFPIDREKASSRASTANLEELFGPAQHMANTRGWEYPNDPDQNMAAGGVLASEKRRSQKKPRRHHSSRSRNEDSIGPVEPSEEQYRNTSERKPKSQKKRDRETERERNKEIERGLRGIKGKDVERDKR